MRVLVKRWEAIGDVLLASSVLPVVAQRHPSLKIDFLTRCPEVLEENPLVNQCVRRVVAETDYQFTYDLNLAYEAEPAIPMLQAFANIVGSTQEHLTVKVRLSSEARSRARTALQRVLDPDRSDYLVLQSATTNWTKNWSPENFSVFVRQVRTRWGVPVLHLGAADDPAVPGAVDLRGTCDILTSASIIESSRGLFGLDSSLMHFAQALNVPCFIIFGPTDPVLRMQQKPHDVGITSELSCRFCHHRQRPLVYSTVCLKQPITHRLMDHLTHALVRRANRNRTRWNLRACRLVGSVLRYREKGGAVPRCMQSIRAGDLAGRVDTWLEQIRGTGRSAT